MKLNSESQKQELLTVIKPTFTFADECLPYHPERKCFIDLIPGVIEIDVGNCSEVMFVVKLTFFQLPLRKPGDSIVIKND